MVVASLIPQGFLSWGCGCQCEDINLVLSHRAVWSAPGEAPSFSTLAGILYEVQGSSYTKSNTRFLLSLTHVYPKTCCWLRTLTWVCQGSACAESLGKLLAYELPETLEIAEPLRSGIALELKSLLSYQDPFVGFFV